VWWQKETWSVFPEPDTAIRGVTLRDANMSEGWVATALANVWSRRSTAAFMVSGWVSHNRVEPSTSASSNVTVPVGSSLMTASRSGLFQLVSLMLASMWRRAAANISKIADICGTGMRTYLVGLPRIWRFG
jgi:hypothetical protein